MHLAKYVAIRPLSFPGLETLSQSAPPPPVSSIATASLPIAAAATMTTAQMPPPLFPSAAAAGLPCPLCPGLNLSSVALLQMHLRDGFFILNWLWHLVF